MAGNNLLDIIKQNTAQSAQTPAPGEQASGIAQLLRAKSGTATSGGPTATVSLAERAEQDNTANTLQNKIAPVATMQNAQLDQAAKAQEETAMAIKDDQSQQGRAAIQQFNNRLDDTLQNLSQSRGQLDLQKDRAQVEQVMQQARLASDKYTTNLRQVGARNRLDSEAGFKEAMAKAAFEDNLSLLQGKLNFDELSSANDRQFQKALSDITINDIITKRDQGLDNLQDRTQFGIGQVRKGASDAARAANLQAAFSSVSSIIGGLAQTGVQVAGQMERQSPTDSAKPTTNKKP